MLLYNININRVIVDRTIKPLGQPESSLRFLRNLVDVKDYIEKFLAERPERFWKDEIFKLRERWKK